MYIFSTFLITNIINLLYKAFLHKIGNYIVKEVVSRKAGACLVTFYHIIPENLKECLFIITISVG